MALFILIGFNAIEIASGRSEERTNVKSELRRCKQEFKTMLQTKEGVVPPEVLYRARKLSRKSRKAFKKGQHADALRFLEDAISILKQVSEQKTQEKRSQSKKQLEKHEKAKPTVVSLRVGSGSVKVLDAVPNFESGKDITTPIGTFKSYQINAENGKVTLELDSSPLFIIESTNVKIDKTQPTVSDETNSPFGVHDIDQFDERLIDLGVNWVRYAAYGALIWDVVEPKKGQFDWSKTDRALKNAYQQGVHMVVNVYSFNHWDQGRGRGHGGWMVKDLGAYKSFLEKAIRRYPFVDAWQIDNEPAQTWADTPENYVELLKESYQVIKGVNPDAMVIIGGAAGPLPLKGRFWSRVLLELGEKMSKGDRCFDVFDGHWFLHITHMEKIEQLTDYIQNIRQSLDRIGYRGTPVWMTEMASYSGRQTDKIHGNMRENSEKQQASELVKLYVNALSLGVSKIFWVRLIEWHNFGRKNGYFDQTGLINNPLNDGEQHKKLAYYSYRNLAKTLSGSKWQDIKTLKLGKNVHAYSFNKNGQTIYALWAN